MSVRRKQHNDHTITHKFMKKLASSFRNPHIRCLNFGVPSLPYCGFGYLYFRVAGIMYCAEQYELRNKSSSLEPLSIPVMVDAEHFRSIKKLPFIATIR